MEFAGKIAAVLAVFAAIGFAGALYDGRHRKVTGGVLAGLLLVCLIANEPVLSDSDCWIEWDGRSNASVCD